MMAMIAGGTLPLEVLVGRVIGLEDVGFDNAADCTSFPASVNIAAGHSSLGCIVFEVPVNARITLVQFTLDAGLGPQTGQWKIPA